MKVLVCVCVSELCANGVCLQVNKDGSGYPPNTLVVGMFEGYYTHPTVNGIISPPKVMHSLTDLLPPMSLLEVSKSEVGVATAICAAEKEFVDFLHFFVKGTRLLSSPNAQEVRHLSSWFNNCIISLSLSFSLSLSLQNFKSPGSSKQHHIGC